jgi:hypothetical protein
VKLTIEQVSKLTKLSIPTLRVYVSRQKLGTKVGNNRFFSQADVQKLLKGTRKTTGEPQARTASKAPSKKAKVAKSSKPAPRPKTTPARTVAAKPVAAKSSVQKAAAPKADKPELKMKPARPSFWSRLFGSRGPKQKINVLEAKSSK